MKTAVTFVAILLAAAPAFLLAAAPAFADTSIPARLALPALQSPEEPAIWLVPKCVSIDTARDELPEASRAHARLLLVRALERLDQLIVETGCTEMIELSHERAGKNIIVRMKSPRASRKLTVSAREDMLDVYLLVAKSLLEAEPPPSSSSPSSASRSSSSASSSSPSPASCSPSVSSSSPSASSCSLSASTSSPDVSTSSPDASTSSPDVSAVTPSWSPTESYPLDESSDLADASVSQTRYWHARVGVAAQQDPGSAYALGFRFGSARRVVDLSLAATSTGSLTTVSARGQYLTYMSPHSKSSTYIGGGVSIGNSSLSGDVMNENSGGFGLEGTAGVEWNRTSKTRYSMEAGLSLPFYTVGDTYPAAFVATFGIGM